MLGIRFKKVNLSIILIGLVSSSSISFGQTFDDKNFAKGIEPGQYYQSFGTDDVNLLNGNLTLSIPIGSELKHNGRLSLQLALRYNSKIFAEEIKPDCTGGATGRVAYLEGRSPVGIGFQLHLGRVYAKLNDLGGDYYYEGPDGNPHRLFNTGDIINGDEAWETRDYTFIRAFKTYDQGLQVGWKIYMPSGTIYTLEHHIPWNGDWWYTNCEQPCCHYDGDYKAHDVYMGYYVSKIEDRHGNIIEVKYKSDPPTNDPDLFACMDTITFMNIADGCRKISFAAQSSWDGEPVYGGIITGITVPKMGGSVTYGFTYTKKPVIYYPQYYVAAQEIPYAGYGAGWTSYEYYNMPMLTDISIPQSNMHILMTYNDFGELLSISYPNGKKISYTYNNFTFSSVYTEKWTWNPQRHCQTVRGVGGRFVYENNTLKASWDYERAGQDTWEYTSHPAWVKVEATKPDAVDVNDCYLTTYEYNYSQVLEHSCAQKCEDGLVETVKIYSGTSEVASDLLKQINHDYTCFYDIADGNGKYFVDTNSFRTTTSWPLGTSDFIRIKETKEDYQDFGHYNKITYSELNTDSGLLTYLKTIKTDWGNLTRSVSNEKYVKWFLNMPDSVTTYTGQESGEVCSKIGNTSAV